MRQNGPRDPVAGPDSGPEPPYPIRLSGPVIKGFGRGSKELGIPTANIPPGGLEAYPSLQTGVYYGVVALDPARFEYNQIEAAAQTGSSESADAEPKKKKNEITILPAVLSIGYNPFYKNEVKSIEIHIMPPLTSPSPTSNENPTTTFFKLPDFYSTHLNLLILGYIRPEFDYVSREALVEDIRIDCEVARKSLMRGGYVRYLADDYDDKSENGEEKVRREREWLRSFGG
ncbi:Riboflavin kinase, putative [Talaromyces stipitatus ATCC 10500]|uniref:Riboflavin kinase n=1 Tax=Talaromyces stipitatus (strain ATCC 10500 / CBS 375.48 / QM 6759 / NRRL 1006) TaxID=441959 RepID=B8LT45_TALSN|nr:Riboflavin kinase, putative [Talaromyces stipitatus ATCC 10500]EED23553.1 Riboflavin kinase, putative [Talaromyces stipitatus ATCC 10500]